MHVAIVDSNAKVCNKLYIARKMDWRWMHPCRKQCNDGCLATAQGTTEKITVFWVCVQLWKYFQSFFAGCRVKFCSLKLTRCFWDWCIPINVCKANFFKSEDEFFIRFSWHKKTNRVGFHCLFSYWRYKQSSLWRRANVWIVSFCISSRLNFDPYQLVW